jgi:SprT protein
MKYKEEYIQEVVRHEFGHAVTRQKYGNTVASHGKEWKEIMRALGDKNPKSTSGLFEIKHSGHIYSCGCTEHVVPEKKHKKMQTSSAIMTCSLCNNLLTSIGVYLEVDKNGVETKIPQSTKEESTC